MTTGVSTTINAVRTVGGGVAFFAGANGVICRSMNNGLTWTTQTTGTTATFRGLAFSSATSGFAVGSGGTICRYNGTTWTPQTTGTTAEFTGVSIVGTTAWAVGTGGVICRYNGTSWAAVPSGVTTNFYAVAFLRDNLGYAVGAGGVICRYNGTSWVAVNSGVTTTFRSIAFVNDTTIVITGDGGLICQSMDGGQTWQTQSSGSSAGLTTVAATGGQVFVFGTGGAGYEYSVNPPPGLEGVTTGTQDRINAAYFSDALTGWIATDNGGVRRTTNGGQTWASSNTGVANNINAIRSVGSVAFLAGANGLICMSTNNGTSWTTQTTGSSATFRGLAFSSTTSGFAVGTGGTICLYNGTTWTAQTTGTTADFSEVSIVGSTAWAVGSGGVICKYNGTSWAPVNSGVTANFYGVAFLRDNLGFAVGAGGLICRYNGTSWVALNSGVTGTFRSVVIADENTVVVSGDSGLVCRSIDGGQTWETLSTGTSASLTSLALAGNLVFAFGSGGTSFSFCVPRVLPLAMQYPSLNRIAGLWEFDDAANPAKATFGNALIFQGAAPVRSASVADDSATALSGVILTPPAVNANRIRAIHGIAPNDGGSRVNQFTILVDIFSPPASRSVYRTIYQTDGNDAEYFIDPTDRFGMSFLGYSTVKIDETKWTRMVITVDLTKVGNDVLTYLDGNLAYTHPNDNPVNGRHSLDPSHLNFFSDDNGENAPLNVGALAIYDGVLTPEAVAVLGRAGNPIPLPLPTFRVTDFTYNPTTRTVNTSFISEPCVEYWIQSSTDGGQTWSILGAPITGAEGATTTTVSGRAVPPNAANSLLLRVRRAAP